MRISLSAQIASVRREIAIRRQVYARQVNAGKMRSSVADYEIACFEAVLATLEWLADHEGKIREDVRSKRPEGDGR